MDPAMMWNALLTIALGLVSWNWNSMANELRRVTILINRVIDRLEALDAKLDRFFDMKSKG